MASGGACRRDSLVLVSPAIPPGRRAYRNRCPSVADRAHRAGGACHRPAAAGRISLQLARDLDALEALDLVAGLDVVVLLDADAALGAGAHFVDVFLEAAQRFELALEDHDVVAQHADRLVALDHALDDQAAGDRAELARAEHVADFARGRRSVRGSRAEHAGERLLHLVDHVVDDPVVAQVDAVSFIALARAASARTLKPMIVRLRGRRQRRRRTR